MFIILLNNHQIVFVLAKKVSIIQKKEILKKYKQGISIKDLSSEFKFSTQTITRQLKSLISEEEFKEFRKNTKNKTNDSLKKELNYKDENLLESLNKTKKESAFLNNVIEPIINNSEDFFEITPLLEGVNLEKQKDISSRPITEFVFPNIVYLLVNKSIELETKYLRDFPEWQFLSGDELNRKTIQIFSDLKIAKKFCNKDQKLIKVPNTKVFQLAAHFLKLKGISRIVNDEYLIAL